MTYNRLPLWSFTLKKTFLLSISFALLMFVCPALAQDDKKEPALSKAASTKIVQMLEESDHAYAKSSSNVWVVKFKGNNIPDVGVVVIGTETMLVLVSVIAEKGEFKATPELMMKLLRFNDDYDRIKVAIDDDGSMIVRLDMPLRIADTAEFKENVEQVSAAADEIYAAIKSFLTPPKKTGK